MDRNKSTTMRSALTLALLLVTAAAQTLTPTNWTSSTQSLQQNSTISVYFAEQNGADSFYVPVVALTPYSELLSTTGLIGNAALVTEDGSINNDYLDNADSNTAAVMSCDHYQGNLQASYVFTVLAGGLKDGVPPKSIILYTESGDYCNLTDFVGNTDFSDSDELSVYSTKSSVNATNLVNKLNGNPDGLEGRVAATENINSDLRHGSGFPTEPPNTAPAMIILYAITGVVAALFVAIIVTGAVRAHRHPERYGPRLIVGRTRQGRAKGLARAMLDTLPIVKFGEREGEQPKDIELGENESRSGSMNTAEQRGAEEQTADAADATPAVHSDTATTAVSQTSPSEPTNNTMTQPPKDEQQGTESGIGGATTQHARNQTTEGASSGPNQSECAICAEDFEAGQDQRVLPCDHRFHPGCIDPWLLNVSGTCPLCRIDLRPAGSGAEGEEDEMEIDENGNPIPRSNDGENTIELPPPIAPQNDPQRISVARAILLTLTHPGGAPRNNGNGLEGLSRHERMEVRRQLAIRRQLEDRRQLALRVARAREENRAAMATAAAAGSDAGTPTPAQQIDGTNEEETEQQVRNRTRVMNFLRRARGGARSSTQQQQQSREPTRVTLRVADPSSATPAAAGDSQT